MKERLIEAKILDFGKLKEIYSDIVYYIQYTKALERTGAKEKPNPPPSLRGLSLLYSKLRIGPLKVVNTGNLFKLEKVDAKVSSDQGGQPAYAIVDFSDGIKVYLAYVTEDPIVGVDLGIRHLFTVVAILDGGKVFRTKYIGNGSLIETFTKYMGEGQGLSYIAEIRSKVRGAVKELADFMEEVSPKVVALEDLRYYEARIGKGLRLVEDLLEKEFIERGIRFKRLDPHNTSRICSRCGYKKGEILGSIFVCPACGYKVDRDFNAAYNLAMKCYYTC
jgi:hypothetical protein